MVPASKLLVINPASNSNNSYEWILTISTKLLTVSLTPASKLVIVIVLVSLVISIPSPAKIDLNLRSLTTFSLNNPIPVPTFEAVFDSPLILFNSAKFSLTLTKAVRRSSPDPSLTTLPTFIVFIAISCPRYIY